MAIKFTVMVHEMNSQRYIPWSSMNDQSPCRSLDVKSHPTAQYSYAHNINKVTIVIRYEVKLKAQFLLGTFISVPMLCSHILHSNVCLLLQKLGVH